MYPHERSLVKQLKDQPFALIGVNSDRDLGQIRRIVEEKNLTWRSFQDEREGKKSISDIWQIKGWPTLFLLDGEGKIRFADIRANEVDAAITELLEEMGHKVELKH